MVEGIAVNPAENAAVCLRKDLREDELDIAKGLKYNGVNTWSIIYLIICFFHLPAYLRFDDFYHFFVCLPPK